MKTRGKKIQAVTPGGTLLRSGLILLIVGLGLLPVAPPAPAQSPEPETGRAMGLEDLKRLALERNLGLKSSEADVLGAKAEARGRYADFFPKLSAEARYSRVGTAPRIQLPAGSFSTAPLLPPTQADVQTGVLANYGLRLTLEQPLFTGGAVYYAYQDARLGSTLAALLHQQNLQDLLLRVELAYWDILKTERLKDVAEQQVRDLTEHLRVVKASYDAGSVPFNEVLKTTVNKAEAEQRLLTAKNDAELARMTMNNLLRQDLTTPLALASREDQPESAELISYEDAVKIARELRPELAAGRTQIRTMEIRRKLAQSGYFPNVSALANYDRDKETPSILPENWEVLGVLRWTFWEWGKTERDVERARLRLRQSELDLQAIEDRIALEVREQYLGAVEAKEKIGVARTAVEQAKENYRITDERFQAGVTTNTEVLDAESLLISAQANLTNAVYDFQSAKARLDRALGRQVLSGSGEGEGKR
ncbi:MAG TPA: TolC family protein [Nitrospiria bacterium]|nr:TolC family protein [Nitrospiria bacterium]